MKLGFSGLQDQERKLRYEEKFYRYLYNEDAVKSRKYLGKCMEHDTAIIEEYFNDLREGIPVWFYETEQDDTRTFYSGEEALRKMSERMVNDHKVRENAVKLLERSDYGKVKVVGTYHVKKRVGNRHRKK